MRRHEGRPAHRNCWALKRSCQWALPKSSLLVSKLAHALTDILTLHKKKKRLM